VADPRVLDVKNAVRTKVAETIALAELVYKRTFRTPTIMYTVKGNMAGWAFYPKWEINLNAFYLLEEFDDMIGDTIPHEVAHLIASAVYGNTIKSHGRQWRGVMRSLGLNPKRCHNYKQQDVRSKKTR